MGSPIDHLNCSFCLKNARDVGSMIAGSLVYICDECVDLAAEVVADKRDVDRLKVQAEARGLALVLKGDAERLAWMRTWTIAGGDHS